MKEKVIALAMAALLALALTGCGEDKSNTNRPGSDSNSAANNGGNDANTDTGGGTTDDGVTDSNNAARNGTGRRDSARYRDNGNDRAFNDNHGSTFGGVGEDLQRDAEQFPPTVYDTMTGAHGAATWRQMLENGFVHDSDGFLLDGENACWS